VTMDEFFQVALELIEASGRHEIYRDSECINLIASEGLKSHAVRETLKIFHQLLLGKIIRCFQVFPSARDKRNGFSQNLLDLFFW